MVDFDKVVNRYGTYSTQWDYVKDRFGESNLLPFTISDMDFKAPQGVTDVLIEAAQKGIFGYTRWNNPEFKGAITSWYSRRYDTKIDADSIVYSPSVIFSLAKLVEQFSNPNDKVVTFSPCYDAFINNISSNNRELVQMNINNGMDLDQLEDIFKNEHPKIFLLCNPQNPLGIAWTQSQLQGMVNLCNDYHVALISDEIHLDMLRMGISAHSVADFFKELTVDCAVLSSASKSFNIPGLGCSYALIPDEKNRLEFLYALKQKNALSSVPYLGMLATIECYNHQESWLDDLRRYIDKNFDYMSGVLVDKLNIDYKIPDATYLGWIDISSLGIDMKNLQQELVKNEKVAIMDGRVYGNGGYNHLRMNLGAPLSKVSDGMDRLVKAVNNINNKK